jgi:glycosyltransferase involved in cell wall biosynthesis
MKIAFIGQKGLPATHGGVERHVEELATRLVTMGHEVVVFTRPNYSAPGTHDYKDVRLVSLPTVGSKHLDAIVHSLLCSLYVLGGGFDVVHYHAIGPCLVSPIARVRGRAVVATIHGQDWRRGKWGRMASGVLRLAEWIALRVPHVTISVSQSLSEWYLTETGRATEYVPNGISLSEGDDVSILEEIGVSDGEYLLYAGRLVPEKGLHYLLEALTGLSTRLPLVVAGDTSFSDDYVSRLREMAGGNVVWAGFIYGDRLAALFRHAALFVLPSDLEGLPIVLLEALGYGVPVLASDIPPNVEVLGEKGRYFTASDAVDLSRQLTACIEDRESLRLRALELREDALSEFNWDRITEETVRVYAKALSRKSRGRA